MGYGYSMVVAATLWFVVQKAKRDTTVCPVMECFSAKKEKLVFSEREKKIFFAFIRKSNDAATIYFFPIFLKRNFEEVAHVLPPPSKDYTLSF